MKLCVHGGGVRHLGPAGHHTARDYRKPVTVRVCVLAHARGCVCVREIVLDVGVNGATTGC